MSPENEAFRYVTPGGCGFCVYIGPTIFGLIQSGTVYRGTLEEALAKVDDAIQKHPLIRSMVVTGDDLAECLKKISTPGNLMYVNYRRLAGGK